MSERLENGRFAAGNKLGGRTHGAINHKNREMKAIITETFDEIGGLPALAAWARENPGDFYKHIWRPLLPTNVKLDVQTVDFTGILESARHRTNTNKVDVIEAVVVNDRPMVSD